MRAPGIRVLAMVAVVLAACGGAGDDARELVAVPYPEPDRQAPAGLEATGTGEEKQRTADDGADDTPALDDGDLQDALVTESPPLATVSDFLADHTGDAVDADHLLADLTEDGTVEVVVATVDQQRTAVVEIARWSHQRLEVTARVDAGAADGVGRLRLANLGERASRMLMLPLQHERATRVAVWKPDDGGALVAPAVCPLDRTGALRTALGTRLLLACEPGVDEALVWRDGAFWPSDVGPGRADGLLDGQALVVDD